MAQLYEDQETAGKARLYRGTAWALVALATLAICYVRFLQYGADGVSVGVGTVGGAMLVFWGVAWAVTRKSSEVSKATGLLVASVLVALSVGMNAWDDYQDVRKSKDLLGQLLGLVDRQGSANAALDAQFESVALDDVLSPQVLLNSANRAEALQRLDKMDALLAQRRELLAKHTAEMEALVAQFSDTEAVAGFLRGKQAAADTFRPIDESQVQFVQLARQVLTWAGKQPTGSMKPVDGRMWFATQRQKDEYLKMMAAVLENSRVQEEALAAGQAQHQRSLDGLGTLRSRLH